MKKLIPLSLICLLLVGISNLQAQTQDDPWGFTTRLGFASYNGDLGNSMLEFGEDVNMAYGLGLSYYISNNFDIAFNFSLVALDKRNPANDPVYSQRTTYFESNIINLNTLLRWKFLNTFVEGRDSRLNPYFAAGLGLGFAHFGSGGRRGCASCSSTGGPIPVNAATPNDGSAFVASIPFGFGMNFELSDGFLFNFQAIYNRSFSDEIDMFPHDASEEKDGFGQNALDDNDHDDWLTTTVGVTWLFGGVEQKQVRKNKMLESIENIESDVDDINNKMDELIELNQETLDALHELQEAHNMSDAQMEELRGKFVRIVNNVQFAFDESYIIEPAHDELESLVDVMKEYQNLGIHLEAYADRRGSTEYNRQLAAERAQSVKDFLTSRGISGSRISTKVYGETEEILGSANSDTDQQTIWAQNRAVQITLSYNGM